MIIMMQHPLSGTEYYRNDDGTVRVVGRDGSEGNFTRLANWISGERRTADPSLCRWISDGYLREEIQGWLPSPLQSNRGKSVSNV